MRKILKIIIFKNIFKRVTIKSISLYTQTFLNCKFCLKKYITQLTNITLYTINYYLNFSCFFFVLLVVFLSVQLTQQGHTPFDPMGRGYSRGDAQFHHEVSRVASCWQCTSPFAGLVHRTIVMLAFHLLTFPTWFQPELNYTQRVCSTVGLNKITIHSIETQKTAV